MSLVDAISHGALCSRCALNRSGRGPVPSQVVPGAPVAYVGEGPGPREIEAGRNFDGYSGEQLERAVKDAGLNRRQLTIVNAFACQPPEDYLDFCTKVRRANERAAADAKANGAPPPEPLLLPHEACYPRLKRDLDESRSPVISPIGNVALQQVCQYVNIPFGTKTSKVRPGEARSATIKLQHGAPIKLPDGRTLLPSLHPAFAQRSKAERRYRGIIREALTRAALIAQGKHPEWREPDFILRPTADEVVNVLARMIDSGQRVSVDIETTGIDPYTCKIRCIGFAAEIDGEEIVIVVPFRSIEGHRPYWNDADKVRVIHIVRRLLDTAPLVGQNFAFDTTVLLRVGLMRDRAKVWDDVAIAHHDTDWSELPHDLGFITTQLFGAPRWKDDADAAVFEGVTDWELHVYCGKDVLAALRDIKALLPRVVQSVMAEPYKVDRHLAVIMRNAGELGLVIDEAKRKEYLAEVSKLSLQHSARVREIVGPRPWIPPNAHFGKERVFNPNSWKQIQRYLYVDKGYTPLVNTDGKEWDEGDEGSTSEAALLKLRMAGVDAETDRFIDAELAFREVEKVKGTYLIRRGVDPVGDVDDEEVSESGLLIHNEQWLGVWLDILHTQYKVHVVPTGRLATSPNIQNWPGKRARWNLRMMVIAPLGHRLVGGDWSGLEMRLTTMFTEDPLLYDAFSKGMDVHSWNAASLLSRGDVSKVQALYAKIKALPKDKKDHWRNIAKRMVYL